MTWFAEAPANIALIKYMGKVKTAGNVPANASLSYTLDDLLSFVEIESHSGNHDNWEPLALPGTTTPFQLSETAQQRFLNHLSYLKQQFNYDGGLTVRSCNNFPQGTGLASSASSFAALTLCANRALSELTGATELTTDALAKLSQQGSGSSCRSFYQPWAQWSAEGVKAIELPYNKLLHQVILVSEGEKKVPSSEAHQRVTTSSFYSTRPQRAEERLKTLVTALKNNDWRDAYEIVWQEFEDMHQLFATSNPPFSYRNEATETALQYLQAYWQQENDGPLVTMDAGPNIHLLFRPDQEDMAAFLKSVLLDSHDVL